MKKLVCFLLMFACVSVFAENWLQGHFGETLVDAEGKEVSVKTLKGKVIGIYYSAHWCPPCRKFTPQLVEFRNKLVKDKKPFEIVFVSFDKSKEEMKEYMKGTEMKWLAVPFNSEFKDKVKKTYNVNSIPTLLILDDKGNMITTEGRMNVMEMGEKAFTRWTHK